MDQHAWHQRYRQQAGWTAGLRDYIYRQIGLQTARRVLEVGCGTGAILDHLTAHTRARSFGIDLDLPALRFAARVAPSSRLCGADAARLPFRPGSFDVTLCHFLLLWVPRAGQALAEMARVTRPGGYVLALAEPDYGARIDYPPELEELGRLQAESLRAQGADPHLGRKLAGLLVGAGLRQVRSGVLGGEWSGRPDEREREQEWAVLAEDLRGRIAPDALHRLRAIDDRAWQSGRRVLFVPTFYAWGTV